jgi:hypothetical protein
MNESRFDREWRRLARKDFRDNLVWPVILILASSSLCVALVHLWPVFGLIIGLISGISLPVNLWLSRKK